MGPHAVIAAGWTGSGKNSMLRTLIESLMWSHPPQNLQFPLADLKGGADVKPFALGSPMSRRSSPTWRRIRNLLGRFVEALWSEIARRKAL